MFVKKIFISLAIFFCLKARISLQEFINYEDLDVKEVTLCNGNPLPKGLIEVGDCMKVVLGKNYTIYGVVIKSINRRLKKPKYAFSPDDNAQWYDTPTCHQTIADTIYIKSKFLFQFLSLKIDSDPLGAPPAERFEWPLIWLILLLTIVFLSVGNLVLYCYFKRRKRRKKKFLHDKNKKMEISKEEKMGKNDVDLKKSSYVKRTEKTDAKKEKVNKWEEREGNEEIEKNKEIDRKKKILANEIIEERNIIKEIDIPVEKNGSEVALKNFKAIKTKDRINKKNKKNDLKKKILIEQEKLNKDNEKIKFEIPIEENEADLGAKNLKAEKSRKKKSENEKIMEKEVLEKSFFKQEKYSFEREKIEEKNEKIEIPVKENEANLVEKKSKAGKKKEKNKLHSKH